MAKYPERLHESQHAYLKPGHPTRTITLPAAVCSILEYYLCGKHDGQVTLLVQHGQIYAVTQASGPAGATTLAEDRKMLILSEESAR